MKNLHYKTKIAVVSTLLTLASLTQVYASEVTGTLSTGLGNSSVTGVVISAPVANPAAGTYTSAQSVTLSSPGSLSIRYTTDGTTVPACTTGVLYSSAISVATTQTLQAVACYANGASSPVSSSLFTVNIPITSGGGGGGGGSSGGGFVPSLALTATSTATSSISSIGGIGQVSTSTVSTGGRGSVLGARAFNFTKNLTVGVRGNDVLELQKVLIASGFLKAATPTNYFGILTRKALIAWQNKYKLPATGYFGPLTRALFNTKNAS
jgi:hypothetical protein